MKWGKSCFSEAQNTIKSEQNFDINWNQLLCVPKCVPFRLFRDKKKYKYRPWWRSFENDNIAHKLTHSHSSCVQKMSHICAWERREKKIYEIFTAVCSLGDFCVRVNSRTFLKMNKLQKKKLCWQKRRYNCMVIISNMYWFAHTKYNIYDKVMSINTFV